MLLLQGLESLFELYGYIKTKNLLALYLSHLLTDTMIFILILFRCDKMVRNKRLKAVISFILPVAGQILNGNKKEE